MKYKKRIGQHVKNFNLLIVALAGAVGFVGNLAASYLFDLTPPNSSARHLTGIFAVILFLIMIIFLGKMFKEN